MADEVQATLARFYRDFVQPDTERVLREIDTVREEAAAFGRKVNDHFDAIYQRFDRLESEYQSLAAAVKRLETQVGETNQRLTSIEAAVRRNDVRQELEQVKARVVALQEKIAELEAQL